MPRLVVLTLLAVWLYSLANGSTRLALSGPMPRGIALIAVSVGNRGCCHCHAERIPARLYGFAHLAFERVGDLMLRPNLRWPLRNATLRVVNSMSNLHAQYL